MGTRRFACALVVVRMYIRRGQNWSICIDSDPYAVMALFLRDLAGLTHREVGPNSTLAHTVKIRGARWDTHGQIKQEWDSWWQSIMHGPTHNQLESTHDLPLQLERRGYPQLARVASAHYGQAIVFADEHHREFSRAAVEYVPQRIQELEKILLDQGVEHAGQSNTETNIRVLEVPLSEPRAWLGGGGTIVASHNLLRDGAAFHSYMEPIASVMFP